MPAIRTIIVKLHWILGITLGVVLGVMGVTGATMAFEDQIMAALSPGVVSVTPRAAPALTPDQLLARLAVEQPGATLGQLTMRPAPGASPQVTVTGDGGGRAKLYLDPYDGRVLGRATGETFFATMRRLHRFLLLPGDARGAGRQITGAAAFSLIFFAISGIYMRWPKRPQGWKYWLKPNLRLRKRGLYWSLHTVIGTWVVLVYLVIATTGLTWSYGWYKSGFTRIMTGRVAAAEAEGDKSKAGVGRMLALDGAWRAITREPGGASLIVLTPRKSAAAPIRARYLPVDAANERAFTAIELDPRTGAVLDRNAYADKTLGERIVSARLSVHRGSFFGVPGMILFALAAAAMPLFPVTGWLLYLARRRSKRGAVRRKAALNAA